MMATRHFQIYLPGLLYAEVWKAADEAFDVTFDYSRLLAGDTIATSTWDLPDGWTEPQASSISTDGQSAVVWVGGGQPGTFSRILNTITTTAGRTYQAWCLCHVKEAVE